MSDPQTHTARTQRFDLRALYETSRILSSSLDLAFVLDNLLLTAMSKLLVTRGAAFLFDPLTSSYKAAAVKGVRGLAVGESLRIEGIVRSALMQREQVPTLLAEHGMHLAISVAYGDREIGLIALGKKALGQEFEDQELEFIHSLVNMSSAAVHNSLMVEELKLANQDLDSKVQQLNTLFDLSQEFNATVDRERIIKLLTFALMGQMLVKRHLFVLRAEGDSEFRVATAKGIGEGDLKPSTLKVLRKLEALHLVDPKDVPRGWGEFAKRGLTLALPIRRKGETLAVMCLGPKMTGQPYQPDDVEFLSALANLAFVSLQNADLVVQQIEKERLEEEMRLAREIQERLQPASYPKVDGLQIAGVAIPSRHVAGDYLDMVQLDSDRLLVAIGDVTGKGVPASLLMSNVQAALHVLLPMDLSIEEATGHLNRVICENTGYDKFITYFHGIYDRRDRSFQYVNAGHNPPMLLRATGEMELLEEGGLLLGVMQGLPYEKGTVTLRPGDVLSLFTDGVTEAMSPLSEEYEEFRLEALLRSVREGNAQEILDAVVADIREFTDYAPILDDDLTMIVVKSE